MNNCSHTIKENINEKGGNWNQQTKEKGKSNSRGGKQAKKHLWKTNLNISPGHSELKFITITDAAFKVTVTFKQVTSLITSIILSRNKKYFGLEELSELTRKLASEGQSGYFNINHCLFPEL